MVSGALSSTRLNSTNKYERDSGADTPGTRTRAPAENKETARNAPNLIRSGDRQKIAVSASTANPRMQRIARNSRATIVSGRVDSASGCRTSGIGSETENTSVTNRFRKHDL